MAEIVCPECGLVTTKTPEHTEHALYRAVPRKWWADVNLYLVTWGQNVCKPVYPRCGACVAAPLCPRVGVTRISKPLQRKARR